MPVLSLLSLLLPLPVLSGCFLAHGLEEDPAAEPEPRAPEEDPERFLFRRGEPSPGRATFTTEVHVLTIGGDTSRLLSLDDGAVLWHVQGNGETVVASHGARSSELTSQIVTVPDAEAFDTGYGGTPHLSEDGETVVHLTSDGIVQLDRDGREIASLAMPGEGGRVSPRQRTIVRRRAGEGRLTLDILTRPEGDIWSTTVDATELGPVFFAADERVVYLATRPEIHMWTASSYELYRGNPSAGEPLAPLDIPPEHSLAGVDRCTDTLYFVDAEGMVLARTAGGPPTPVTREAGSAGISLNRPFAEVAAPSPDGRYLVWLSREGDLYVADLAAGTTRAVDMPHLPVPSACCGDVLTEVALGNFVGDAMSVGVTPASLRPLCSCAPLEPATEPLAFRVDLADATAEGVEHCGRSTPWLTRDGDMLVCREDEEGRVRIGVASDDGFAVLTDGPWDVGAIPLAPREGCGLPAR